MGRRGLTQKEIKFFMAHPIAALVVFGPILFFFGIFFYYGGLKGLGALSTFVGAVMLFSLLVIGIVKLVSKPNKGKEIKTTPSIHHKPARPTKYEEIDISYITQLEGAELDHDAIRKILRQEKKELEDSRMLMGKTYTIERVRIENGRVKVQVEVSEEYRTVERYVQQNYVRTPIYSDTKVKYHSIEKSFKLTNAELEALNGNSEFILSRFSHQIITLLGDPALVPSWYLEQTIKSWQREIDKALFRANQTADDLRNALKIELPNKIAELLEEINKVNASLEKLYKKRNRKNNVSAKITDRIEGTEKRLRRLEEQLETLKKQLDSNESIYEHNKSIYAAQKAKVNEICSALLGKIKKLPTDVAADEANFILLCDVQKMERQKIIGVYVIRNRLNNRCYVGQSKDVMRRLNQHFKGTEPKNIIFAEDYYSTPAAERERLFEIKVILLSTKDELDTTEKNLIEEYDAFVTGYNGTAGNT